MHEECWSHIRHAKDMQDENLDAEWNETGRGRNRLTFSARCSALEISLLA
jgi:hypothetical protein